MDVLSEVQGGYLVSASIDEARELLRIQENKGGGRMDDALTEDDYIRAIYEIAEEAGEGVYGKIHIIDVGHERWDNALCIHHADGYGVWVGDEIVIRSDYSNELIYYYECIDNFKEISPKDFLELLNKEIGRSLGRF